MVSHNTVKGGNDTIRRSVAAITMPCCVDDDGGREIEISNGFGRAGEVPKKNSRALFRFDKLVNFGINDEYLGNFKQNGVEKSNNQRRRQGLKKATARWLCKTSSRGLCKAREKAVVRRWRVARRRDAIHRTV